MEENYTHVVLWGEIEGQIRILGQALVPSPLPAYYANPYWLYVPPESSVEHPQAYAEELAHGFAFGFR